MNPPFILFALNVARNQYQSALDLPRYRRTGRGVAKSVSPRFREFCCCFPCLLHATFGPWRPVHIIQVNWLSVYAPNHAIKACEEMARSAFKGRKEIPQHSEDILRNFDLVKENTRSHFTGAKSGYTHMCSGSSSLFHICWC